MCLKKGRFQWFISFVNDFGYSTDSQKVFESFDNKKQAISFFENNKETFVKDILKQYKDKVNMYKCLVVMLIKNQKCYCEIEIYLN